MCVQTDRFELEAVTLMSVDKVVIGHNSATAGIVIIVIIIIITIVINVVVIIICIVICVYLYA